ncbi:thioredoxin family protein [Flexithrix dorotheae]|uniref:thioredoxin family protein n=1 Tax=Flexithrix dorotheae TaxID=70993 RepID=UPI000476C1FC|nr:thioredoxin family protein [Flexithrix dorotheae]
MKLRLTVLLFLMIGFGSISIQAQDNAAKILNAALKKAKVENKKVFIKYSASWCGWCKRMDKQMKSEACKTFFEDNYITIQLIVHESKDKKYLENPGALDLLKKYKGEKSGLPFWVILDENGQLLEDSFNEEGQNLGCPATEEEVQSFISKLKNTSNLKKKELEVIAETFQSK